MSSSSLDRNENPVLEVEETGQASEAFIVSPKSNDTIAENNFQKTAGPLSPIFKE